MNQRVRDRCDLPGCRNPAGWEFVEERDVSPDEDFTPPNFLCDDHIDGVIRAFSRRRRVVEYNPWTPAPVSRDPDYGDLADEVRRERLPVAEAG